MNLLNKKYLQELKQLKQYLKENYNQNQHFRKIYEGSNNKKDKSDEDVLVILTDNGNHILSNISKEVIEYFVEKRFFSEVVYNPDTKTIRVDNVSDLLRTIEILMDILEFHLLSKSVELNEYDVS